MVLTEQRPPPRSDRPAGGARAHGHVREKRNKHETRCCSLRHEARVVGTPPRIQVRSLASTADLCQVGPADGSTYLLVTLRLSFRLNLRVPLALIVAESIRV